jgi:capsular exopolysaccharide synthesis family protein
VEAFKTLRTNVHFIQVDQPPRIVLVGSGSPSEGKSTVAVNYAVAVAQAGKRVVLVDCDLRRPTIHRFFGLEPSPGLTDCLADATLGIDGARATAIPNLRVVSSGPIPPNPSEVLGSQRMTAFLQLLTEHADLVLLDSSAALVVTDATVLAPHVDGVLLVVDEERSKLRATLRAVRGFTMVGGKVLGVVVNKCNPRTGGYGYHDHVRYYKSDQGGDAGDATDQYGGQRSRNVPAPALSEAAQPGVLTVSAPAGNGHEPVKPGVVARVLAGLGWMIEGPW